MSRLRWGHGHALLHSIAIGGYAPQPVPAGPYGDSAGTYRSACTLQRPHSLKPSGSVRMHRRAGTCLNSVLGSQ
eukprot:2357912-Amphidinium_carterae.1